MQHQVARRVEVLETVNVPEARFPPEFTSVASDRRLLLLAGMAGWKDIREIAAWRHANELKLRADEIPTRPEVRRRFRYCEQLADAVRSAPSNIAEGFGRFGNKEFARYARIAKASQVEVLNHFIDAHDQGLLTDEEYDSLEHCIRRALKTTVGLIRHLESNPDPNTETRATRGTRGTSER